MGIEVQAFRVGFFDGERKRVGDRFVVSTSTIESGWFEPVDPKVKLRPRPELTPAQKAERKKIARGKAKKAERARIDAERKKVVVKDKPIALSQMHQDGTAREQAAVRVQEVEAPQAADQEEGATPLA